MVTFSWSEWRKRIDELNIYSDSFIAVQEIAGDQFTLPRIDRRLVQRYQLNYSFEPFSNIVSRKFSASKVLVPYERLVDNNHIL